jgi:hypothetical protein
MTADSEPDLLCDLMGVMVARLSHLRLLENWCVRNSDCWANGEGPCTCAERFEPPDVSCGHNQQLVPKHPDFRRVETGARDPAQKPGLRLVWSQP